MPRSSSGPKQSIDCQDEGSVIRFAVAARDAVAPCVDHAERSRGLSGLGSRHPERSRGISGLWTQLRFLPPSPGLRQRFLHSVPSRCSGTPVGMTGLGGRGAGGDGRRLPPLPPRHGHPERSRVLSGLGGRHPERSRGISAFWTRLRFLHSVPSRCSGTPVGMTGGGAGRVGTDGARPYCRHAPVIPSEVEGSRLCGRG